ncbi:MAG: CAP domain-containing protein [Bacillota bacterium]
MKQVISVILIFLLIFPVLIFAFSSSVYAFGGLDLSSTFAKIIEGLLALFFLDKIFNPEVKDVGTDRQENNSSNLDWKTREVERLTAAENKMLNLINQARTKNKLQPLKINYNLVKIAREKSRDMIKNDYFAHHSPTYGSPFNMFETLGINYYLAGENIAGAAEVESAHQELMNSKDHRDNILDPSFTDVGVGIIKGGPYGQMYTQEFADLKK